MDHSDGVADEVLIAGSAARAPEPLAFRRRAPWVAALALGSWGLILVVPTSIFALSGEIPLRGLPFALALPALGLAFWYSIARGFVNRVHLERDGVSLRVRSAPLWPARERRWAFAAIAGTRVELRPDSFRHPATWRGRPVARPSVVSLVLADGSSARLPLALSGRHAREVASWIARAGAGAGGRGAGPAEVS